MIRVEHSVVIDRPAQEVADRLADIERMTDWTDMQVSRKLTPGPVGPGTRGYAEVAIGPARLGWTYELTEISPDRGVTYRTVSKNALGMDGRYRLSPSGQGATRVHATIEITTRGLLRLLEPIIRGEITRGETAELERLKALLEQGGAPAATARAPAAETPRNRP